MRTLVAMLISGAVCGPAVALDKPLTFDHLIKDKPAPCAPFRPDCIRSAMQQEIEDAKLCREWVEATTRLQYKDFWPCMVLLGHNKPS